MKKFYVFLLIASISVALFLAQCGKQETEEVSKEEVQKMEQKFKNFADSVEGLVSDAYTNAASAFWVAANSGEKEDFDKSAELEMELNKILADREIFAKLKKFKESNLIRDNLLSRHLKVMYNAFLGNQIDTTMLEKMTNLQSEISQKFQTYRAEVDGKEYTDNEVEEALRTCKDSEKLEKVWKAHKDIGPVVAEDIIKLVKLRNKAAKDLGFDNYHQMSLTLSEQDPENIEKLFDELDKLTKKAYGDLKKTIDEKIAEKCGEKIEDLQPWHYQNRYFQEAPKIYELDLDKYYEGKDIEQITKDYYASIGMTIDTMVARSDLYEREGKNQHAFCTDIDIKGKEIRILCNIKDNASWMNTMLHEFGHGVYFKYIDDDLPWFLSQPAHIFTTEAIAMLFGRFYSNAQWMKDMLKISDEDKEKIADVGKKILRLEQLVFSRWSQVMYRFEKSLYENPDQDLNKLWWDLVEEYQLVEKPEGRDMPDWATKTHIASSPCYYHNYLLGELLASQLYMYIKTDIIGAPKDKQVSFYDNKKVGGYLIEQVFAPGARYYWNDMINRATGEKLTPKYYAEQFECVAPKEEDGGSKGEEALIIKSKQNPSGLQ